MDKAKPVYRKDVLRYALRLAVNKRVNGLCGALIHSLVHYNVIGLFSRKKWLVDCFPLFTREIAEQFNASYTYGPWWWEYGCWDTGRMEFLKWLIKMYKNDKTDLTKL